jgi:hypothetical protein
VLRLKSGTSRVFLVKFWVDISFPEHSVRRITGSFALDLRVAATEAPSPFARLKLLEKSRYCSFQSFSWHFVRLSILETSFSVAVAAELLVLLIDLAGRM